ncbi:MAG: hypothetical protein VKL39_11035 [Leptolyngbyaceae bacterium]|nr:hypothetical protein [Leptolyngbyaceae bacterium]
MQRSDNHLRIWQTGDRPNTLWSATNSQTGQSIYQVSENDLRRWIEHQYNQPSSPLAEQQLVMMNLVRH